MKSVVLLCAIVCTFGAILPCGNHTTTLTGSDCRTGMLVHYKIEFTNSVSVDFRYNQPNTWSVLRTSRAGCADKLLDPTVNPITIDHPPTYVYGLNPADGGNMWLDIFPTGSGTVYFSAMVTATNPTPSDCSVSWSAISDDDGNNGTCGDITEISSAVEVFQHICGGCSDEPFATSGPGGSSSGASSVSLQGQRTALCAPADPNSGGTPYLSICQKIDATSVDDHYNYNIATSFSSSDSTCNTVDLRLSQAGTIDVVGAGFPSIGGHRFRRDNTRMIGVPLTVTGVTYLNTNCNCSGSLAWALNTQQDIPMTCLGRCINLTNQTVYGNVFLEDHGTTFVNVSAESNDKCAGWNYPHNAVRLYDNPQVCLLGNTNSSFSFTVKPMWILVSALVVVVSVMVNLSARL